MNTPYVASKVSLTFTDLPGDTTGTKTSIGVEFDPPLPKGYRLNEHMPPCIIAASTVLMAIYEGTRGEKDVSSYVFPRSGALQ